MMSVLPRRWIFSSKLAALCSSARRYATRSIPRSYSDSIVSLNTLQANHATVERIRENPAAMHAVAIPEMHDWLRRAGYKASDFNELNAIHIAGTKGKGSTAAFISSILGQYLSTDPGAFISKVGLYTSPHLRFVRERIQINNSFISEPKFAKSFFEVWDRLEATTQREGIAPEGSDMPAYFRFLTILALHVYLTEGVNSAVIECGTGGEYDSTNILQKPTVTGITSLGIDHTPMLGDTIDKIAWHKAGIMKRGVPCFTVPQPDAALKVLKQVAKERDVELNVVSDIHPEIKATKLGLSGKFQQLNASLAISIASRHLQSISHNRIKVIDFQQPLPREFVRGLENAYIGGRCETRIDSKVPISWRIDGAHTIESIEAAAEWFATCVKGTGAVFETPRVLVFNQQTREGLALLAKLHSILETALSSNRPFTNAIFCTNKTFDHSGYRPDLISINTNKSEVESLEVQERLATAWVTLCRIDKFDEGVKVVSSIEAAVNECRKLVLKSKGKTDQNLEIFVTGSLHLVGGILEVLES